MVDDYEHVTNFWAEKFHGLKSTKTTMEQTFKVMFKKLCETSLYYLTSC
jgi:hypothetical protein